MVPNSMKVNILPDPEPFDFQDPSEDKQPTLVISHEGQMAHKQKAELGTRYAIE